LLGDVDLVASQAAVTLRLIFGEAHRKVLGPALAPPAPRGE